MDALSATAIITLITSIFAGLAVASTRWGVDSRPGLGDDHAR